MPFAIVRDDITHMKADAIVNAANERLWRGGGVCGSIFEAAGVEKLQRACEEIGHCETGEAVATPAFGLHARHIIHAVGPVWMGGTHGERKQLASCYRTSLELADSLGCESIAFPLISAGIYGYPPQEALEIAQQVIRTFLASHEMDVTLVLFNSDVVQLADNLRLRIQSYIDDVYVEKHERRRSREGWEQQSILIRQEAARRAEEEAASSAEATAWSEVSENTPEPLADSLLAPDATDADAMPETSQARPFDGASASAYQTAPSVGSANFSMSAAPMPQAAPAPQTSPSAAPSAAPQRKLLNLPRPLRQLLAHMDAGFSQTLLALIDERGLKDAEVYRRANMSRQHFSKMRSNPSYRPKKTTVLALAVALELTLEETTMLLERAGFALSHADQRDIIVEFFIKEGVYDVFAINDALFAFDQPLLG